MSGSCCAFCCYLMLLSLLFKLDVTDLVLTHLKMSPTRKENPLWVSILSASYTQAVCNEANKQHLPLLVSMKLDFRE